jgi:hypothetical protein
LSAIISLYLSTSISWAISVSVVYTYDIGKIYTSEEIENAKQSPSFEREYNLKYQGTIGNV